MVFAVALPKVKNGRDVPLKGVIIGYFAVYCCDQPANVRIFSEKKTPSGGQWECTSFPGTSIFLRT